MMRSFATSHPRLLYNGCNFIPDNRDVTAGDPRMGVLGGHSQQCRTTKSHFCLFSCSKVPWMPNPLVCTIRLDVGSRNDLSDLSRRGGVPAASSECARNSFLLSDSRLLRPATPWFQGGRPCQTGRPCQRGRPFQGGKPYQPHNLAY